MIFHICLIHALDPGAGPLPFPLLLQNFDNSNLLIETFTVPFIALHAFHRESEGTVIKIPELMQLNKGAARKFELGGGFATDPRCFQSADNATSPSIHLSLLLCCCEADVEQPPFSLCMI